MRPPKGAKHHRCGEKGCDKFARGGTNFCIGHGGGNRCGMKDCDKSAQGGTNFCIGHGGGNRCGMKDCNKFARGGTGFCIGHRGGKCNMRQKRKNFKASTAAAGSHSVRVVSDARATIQANLTAELVKCSQPHIQIVWGTGAWINSSVPPNLPDFNPQQLGAYVETLEIESYKLSCEGRCTWRFSGETQEFEFSTRWRVSKFGHFKYFRPL